MFTGMLTFAVEKELNVVYFDGSSAANSVTGHQDAQDLVIYGKVRPDKVMAERERITELCAWAEKFDIDAIVRYVPLAHPSQLHSVDLLQNGARLVGRALMNEPLPHLFVAR